MQSGWGYTGGLLVCYGVGCNAKFIKCKLHCPVVVMAGANVEMDECSIVLNNTANGVGLFVTGLSTKVQMMGANVSGGLQGITVQAGASCVMNPKRNMSEEFMETFYTMLRSKIQNFGFAGIDVGGQKSTLEMNFVDIHGTQGENGEIVASYGVHVHSSAKGAFSNGISNKAEICFDISTTVPVSLNRCEADVVTAGLHLTTPVCMHNAIQPAGHTMFCVANAIRRATEACFLYSLL
jgi:hypothetical protein